MQRVSYKTLVLLLMLLGMVLVQQHTAKAMCVKVDAIWLADDPNEPSEPVPECFGAAGSQTWLDTDDPNEPCLPSPEMALGVPSSTWLGDDPNQPSEPSPERA